MRASVGLACSLVAFAVACSSNTPLMSGSAGMSSAAGASTGAAAGGSGAGSGGASFAGTTGQAGAASPTGQARDSPTGQGGVAGTAPAITLCGAPTMSDGTCAARAYNRNGVCTCVAGTNCVCLAGCTDLTTDDDNCGACGIHCGPTSTCNNGVCGPPVVNVVPASPGCGTIDIAVGDGTLYWADAGHGIVRSMPLAGGMVTTMSKGDKPSRIVAAGNAVYWLYASQTIWRNGPPNIRVFSASAAIGAPSTSSRIPTMGSPAWRWMEARSTCPTRPPRRVRP